MERGVFITLSEEKDVKFALKHGVFGQYLSPAAENPSYQHFRTLADYASVRAGDHVFLFCNRRIWYAGEIQGTEEHASFVINGKHSPLGQRTDAPLSFDPTTHPSISSHDKGVFDVSFGGRQRQVAQPYLLVFDTDHEMSGRSVTSDYYYQRLASYDYPLPTNTLTGQTFTLMTPAEVDKLLATIRNRGNGSVTSASPAVNNPQWFDPSHTVSTLAERQAEAHLEALLLANPSLRPSPYDEAEGAWCRQVPVSPFKPDIDYIDLGLYADDPSFPATVIELKHSRAGAPAARQLNQYKQWFDMVGKPTPSTTIVAPSFAETFDPELQGTVRKIAFDD